MFLLLSVYYLYNLISPFNIINNLSGISLALYKNSPGPKVISYMYLANATLNGFENLLVK